MICCKNSRVHCFVESWWRITEIFRFNIHVSHVIWCSPTSKQKFCLLPRVATFWDGNSLPPYIVLGVTQRQHCPRASPHHVVGDSRTAGGARRWYPGSGPEEFMNLRDRLVQSSKWFDISSLQFSSLVTSLSGKFVQFSSGHEDNVPPFSSVQFRLGSVHQASNCLA